MQNSFHELRVSGKQAETPDASVIYFEVPEALQDDFQFKAGQYLTLKIELNGQEERRAYSMCTSPLDERIGVCVKRLAGGKVSNYLLDKLQVGDRIAVMPPDGRFVAEADASRRTTYYLIGAGSGITPLMSIARTVLAKEVGSAVHLLYGNRNENSIIFKQELEAMQADYAGQFSVDHILSQPAKRKAGGLGGMFGKKVTDWNGRIGRIDVQELERYLSEREARTDAKAYYICGPGAMIDTVEKALLRKGIPADQIHTERFVVAEVAAADKIQGVSDGAVKVTLDGQVIELDVASDKTILEALVDAGHNPPYSCTSGACSTCIAKVTAGEVKMDVNHALDPDEVEEGYCLTCQAHPVTAGVEVSYDE